VIAARTRSYVELTDGEASGWLFTPGDRESLRSALEAAAASREDAARRGANALLRAEELAWPEIGERTAHALGVSA
jgi:glycosyltransferase involved in cell wall biosynthesis